MQECSISCLLLLLLLLLLVMMVMLVMLCVLLSRRLGHELFKGHEVAFFFGVALSLLCLISTVLCQIMLARLLGAWVLEV
jgi:hypothetical protein